MADSEFQMVPVPSQYVPQVYRFLADLTAGVTLAMEVPLPEPGSDQEFVKVPNNGTWTRADLAELNRVFQNKAGRAVLTTIARASLAGREVSYGELRAAGATEFDGFTFGQLRAQLSWLSKYCKRIKGAHHWPLVIRDLSKGVSHPPPTPDRYLYKVDERIATWWLEESGAADEADATPTTEEQS